MTQNVFVSYAREDASSENNLIDEFLKHGNQGFVEAKSQSLKILKESTLVNSGAKESMKSWKKLI